MAVASVIVIALLAQRVVSSNTAQQRYDRITSIYDNFKLGAGYPIESADVFGDKRVNNADRSRTYSSMVEYLHGDTVSNTVADVDTKIKASGFAFFDEPYPGSKEVQYHYKSKNHEYVRLTVKSKPYMDALLNANAMKQGYEALQHMDTNQGPALVTIKVNLDDNNE